MLSFNDFTLKKWSIAPERITAQVNDSIFFTIKSKFPFGKPMVLLPKNIINKKIVQNSKIFSILLGSFFLSLFVFWITCMVQILSPDQKNQEFSREILIANTDNPEDTITISIVCNTPRSKIYQMPLFRFFENCPSIYLIINKILKL